MNCHVEFSFLFSAWFYGRSSNDLQTLSCRCKVDPLCSSSEVSQVNYIPSYNHFQLNILSAVAHTFDLELALARCKFTIHRSLVKDRRLPIFRACHFTSQFGHRSQDILQTAEVTRSSASVLGKRKGLSLSLSPKVNVGIRFLLLEHKYLLQRTAVFPSSALTGHVYSHSN